MIEWNNYKVFKLKAERFLQEGYSKNDYIQIEILKFKLNRISKEQSIENIINILSDGEHFKPLSTK